MFAILINSQKGGSSKSMLTKHLAVEAERAGDGPVYIIDTDPQGTLLGWYERRPDGSRPILTDLPFAAMERGLQMLRDQGVKTVIVDSAAGRLEEAGALIGLVDFVVVPCKASDDDLAAAPRTVDLIRDRNKPFLFVLTQIKPNTLVTAQAAARLSKQGQVAETVIMDRTAYASRYADGQTITEADPKGKAAREISCLWENIKSCMHESMQLNKKGVKRA